MIGIVMQSVSQRIRILGGDDGRYLKGAGGNDYNNKTLKDRIEAYSETEIYEK